MLETIGGCFRGRRVYCSRKAVNMNQCISENLECYKMSLEACEAELVEGCRRLVRDTLLREQQGDTVGAKTKLMERR